MGGILAIAHITVTYLSHLSWGYISYRTCNCDLPVTPVMGDILAIGHVTVTYLSHLSWGYISYRTCNCDLPVTPVMGIY